MESAFDDLLSEHRGRFGYFQLGLSMFGWCVSMCASMCMALPLFILAIPDHRCALDGWENDTYSVQNSYHRQLINASIPVDENGQMSSCTIFTYDDVNGIASNIRREVPCQQWVYDKALFERSLVGELDIVCGRKYLRTIGNMLVHVALLVAAPFPGLISDRFGRKVSVTYCVIALSVAAWCSGFIHDVPSLYVMFFIIGLGVSQGNIITFVLVVEVLEQRYRRLHNCLTYIFWGIGSFFVLGIYALVRDSQHLSFAIAASTSLLLIALWFIPESPRWLLSKGRQSHARAVLLRMARINGVDFNEDVFTEVAITFKSEEQNIELSRMNDTHEHEDIDINIDQTENGFCQMFKHTSLCIRLLVLIFCLFTHKLVFSAFMFNLAHLAGSFHLNFGLFNSVQMVSVLITFFTIDRVGRSLSYLVLMFLATVACLASVFPVFLGTPAVTRIAMNGLGLVAILGINGAFAVLNLYRAELVPTLHRSMAISLFDISGRVGGIVGAFVADLGALLGGRLEPALPLLVSGMLLLVAFLSSWVLPETKGTSLPNTVQEAIMLKHNRRIHRGNEAI